MPASTLCALAPSVPALQRLAGSDSGRSTCWPAPALPPGWPCLLLSTSGPALSEGSRVCATSPGQSKRRRVHVSAVLADPPRTSTAAPAAPAATPGPSQEELKRRGGGNTAELGLTDSYQGGLKSTWEHRAWVSAGSAALLGALTKGLCAVDSPEDAAAAAAAIVAAYLLADLGTGVYHWSVDNYGDASTPIFGSQIDAFQGHHRRPWTITQRQFANNLYALCRPAAFFVAPFLLLPSSAPGHCFLAVFVTGVVFSQQFHSWAHMKKSALPAPVVALQDAGVLVSRKAHGAHHRPPFENNYCIVSGIWNKALDRSGVFKAAERFVFARTGVAPRNWTEDGEEFKNLKYYESSGSDSE